MTFKIDSASTLPRYLGPVGVTLLIHTLLMGVYVAQFDWDFSAYVCAGKERLGTGPYSDVGVGFDKMGYDGQFYFVIAQFPWQKQVMGVDVPVVRHSRIMYPALAWILSGGDSNFLFYILPAINLAAIGFLTWIGAWFAERNGLSPWWSITLPLAVNVGLPALRNLADPLSTLGVAGLLAGWTRRSPALSLLGAAVAVFAREQNIALAGLVFLTAVLHGEKRIAVAVTAVIAAWFAWMGVLHGLYERWAFMEIPAHSRQPFAGLWMGLVKGWTEPGIEGLIKALGVIHLFITLGLAVCACVWKVDWVLLGICLLGAAAVVLAGDTIYASPWSFARVFAWLPIGVWFASVMSKRTWPILLMLPACLWSVLAVIQAMVQ